MDFSKYAGIVEKTQREFVESNKDFTLYEPVEYILNLGGKRLRPILTLLVADLYDADLRDVARPAFGIEVFHNFTLLHDDIMDNAPLRRGKQTVHEKWNINAGILSGDVMFVQAFSLVTSCETKYLRRVLDLFNVTAIEVCEGQQYDMDFEKRSDVTIEEYIEMIRLKTSVLVGCAMELGAILAGVSEDESKLIYAFGEKLGIAFQIKDDVLDVFGDSELVGKQVGGDILANKKTFLLLQAQKDAGELISVELKKWLDTDDKSLEKVDAVKEIYSTLNVKEKAERLMDEYYETAIESLHETSLPESKKEILVSFADGLMNRKF